MICSKCKNEIQEGEKFCSNCGKKIRERENSSNENNEKHSKVNKKLIYIIISIVVIIGVVIGIVLLNNKDTSNDNDIDTNVSSTEETNNNTENKVQDFKYVQKDDKAYTGKSFKNVDFEIFKNNLRQLWFKNDLEYDIVKQRNIAIFGEEYSQWQVYNGEDGEPYEELKSPYLKGNSYIIGRLVDIYYNEDKTNVHGFAIYVSDYYLGRVGRSNLTNLFFEVLECLPSDFAEEVKERYYNDKEYEDFYARLLTTEIENETYHILSCMCVKDTDEIKENDNVINTTDTNEINNNETKKGMIKQNEQYVFTDYNSLVIKFANDKFTISTNNQNVLYGTYEENEENLTLKIESVENVDGTETALGNVNTEYYGKIYNNGESINLTIENQEFVIELNK